MKTLNTLIKAGAMLAIVAGFGLATAMAADSAQELQELLQDDLLLLPEVLRREVRQLLQVSKRFGSAEAVLKKKPASALRNNRDLKNHESQGRPLRFCCKAGSLTIEPGSGFNRGVWSRIGTSRSRYPEALSDLLSWIQSMGRPSIAIAAAAIALFGGVLIGGVQAHSSQEERYLTSLNPLITHRPAPTT